MIWDEKHTNDLFEKILSKSKADETEAIFQAQDYGLTRFTGNAIHQNMREDDAVLTVRVAHANRLGTCSTNQLDDQGIQTVVDKALAMAELNEVTPDFAGFARPTQYEKVTRPTWYSSTASAGPDERANQVGRLLRLSANQGFEAAGALQSGELVSAVATSHGVSAYQLETRAHALTVVNRPGQTGFGTGFANWYGRDLSELDIEAMGERALSISARNQGGQAIDPGDYTVVLAPAAVGLLLYYLSWMGLHARALQSKQSFMTGRIGQPVLSEKLSIWDDGLDGSGYGIPFDWEGRPKQRVEIIRDGRACGVVYDSFTAAREQRLSTGHALSPLRDHYYSSPMPEHLFMAPGNDTMNDMIASTKRGIWINHFWYVREVQYGRAIVTGMTRDGTFLIEDGKITRPLYNLRFTESVVDAFGQVEMVGNETHLSDQFIGSASVPALKLTKFHVTGSSSY